jgi:glycosyltransferase involved in cell wall biosynthesis
MISQQSSLPSVMFVTNSLSGGGAERASNIIVNELTKAGLRVSLSTVNLTPPDSVIIECEHFEIGRPWRGGFISTVKALIKLQFVVFKWKPQILVLNCDLPELLGSVLIGGFKVIAVEHASQPWPRRNTLGKMIRFLLNMRSTKWIAVSGHLKIWGLNRRPEIVISNPILAQLDSDYKLRLNFSAKIGRLVFMGRLSDEKNPELLLEIATLSRLPVRYIGDGPLRANILNKARELSLSVECLGYKTKPWEFLGANDLLIVPSNNEGDGLVLVEAIANRVPIIVRAIPDLLRFELPTHNYCSSALDFSDRISKYSNEIEKLIIPESNRDLIMIQRNSSKIASQWIEFLTKVG